MIDENFEETRTLKTRVYDDLDQTVDGLVSSGHNNSKSSGKNNMTRPVKRSLIVNSSSSPVDSEPIGIRKLDRIVRWEESDEEEFPELSPRSREVAIRKREQEFEEIF